MAKEEKQKIDKEGMLKTLKDVDEISIMNAGLSDPNFAEEAKKKRESEGIRYATEFNKPGSDKPYITKSEYGSVDQKKQEEIRETALGFRQASGLEEAIMGLRTNSKEILFNQRDNGKVDLGLAKIAAEKPIIENVSKESQRNALLYAEIVKYKDIAKAAKNNEKLDIQNEEEARKILVEGKFQQEYDRLLGLKLSDKVAKLGATLESIGSSIRGIKDEKDRKLVEAGANRIADQYKNQMGLKEGQTAEEFAAKYTADALVKMAGSRDENERNMAANLYYKSQKGYSIGERGYDVAFPKKKDK